MNSFFEKKKSSVFVICSPFQALCAMEAIKEFEITDYHFIVGVRNEQRDKQIESLLQQWNISYEKIYLFDKKRILLNAIFSKKRKFDRAFIGDFRDSVLNFIALGFLSNKGCVVYLDDGNITISYLQGIAKVQKAIITTCIYKIIIKLRFIVDRKIFFTLYSDIALKGFCCKQNNFSSIKSLLNNKKNKDDIYIIGTNISAYCEKLLIPLENFKNSLKALIIFLQNKYKSKRIIYIPHGRDIQFFPQEICEECGIEYLRLNEIVELYMLKLSYQPIAIYSWTSTALLNLKKIFPDTHCYNFLSDEICINGNKDYITISNYYEKNGIISIKISDIM